MSLREITFDTGLSIGSDKVGVITSVKKEPIGHEMCPSQLVTINVFETEMLLWPIRMTEESTHMLEEFKNGSYCRY